MSSATSTHSWLIENNDVDSDGDGLSDFQELHKYFTDPNEKDSDHDGIPDGDWHERQEFTYVIQSTVEVVRPISLDAANSDYQDARIISENSKSVTLEVLSFPLNSNMLAVSENRNWKIDYASMSKYLASTRTSNYDAAMASDIINGIKAKFGLDLFTLTDKQAVEWVTAFISSEQKNTTPFVTYFVDFPATGQITLNPETLSRAQFEPANKGWDFSNPSELISAGIFAMEMHKRKSMGSCTPAHIQIVAALRSIGIPARLIMTVPVVDGNDAAQKALASAGITHNELRPIIEKGLEMTSGWASHTYAEVFIGNRWQKLNYGKIGQNNVDEKYFGLMIQVNTMIDWSDENYTSTWGMRVADTMHGRSHDPLLKDSSNPYMAMQIQDSFGVHSQLKNPAPQALEMAVTKSQVKEALWDNDPVFLNMIKGKQQPSFIGQRILWLEMDFLGAKVEKSSFENFAKNCAKEQFQIGLLADGKVTGGGFFLGATISLSDPNAPSTSKFYQGLVVSAADADKMRESEDYSLYIIAKSLTCPVESAAGVKLQKPRPIP